MNTLTYKQLNIILDVLNNAKREQANITYTHDEIVKASLKGSKEKLDYLVDIQVSNYDRKENLEHSYYAIEAIIKDFE